MPKTSTAEHFALAALDTVSSSLAFLDERGGILSTNMPWQEFGRANGGSAAQAAGAENYLTICDQATGAGSEGAQAMAQGIRAVIQGPTGQVRTRIPLQFAD